MLFADDFALNARSEQEMQHNMDIFLSACDAFGLTINPKTMEVTYQPAPRKEYSELIITVNGETLKALEKFIHIGCTLSLKLPINDEAANRIAKASAFRNVSEKVWEKKSLSLETKLKVYKSCRHCYVPVRLGLYRAITC